LIAQLAAADRSLKEERLPPRAVRRIANRISREIDRPNRSRRLGWIPMFTFVAGAALVLLFVAWARTPGGSEAPSVASAREEQQARISGPDCHHRQRDAQVLEISGACEVITFAPALRIQTVEEAALTVEGPRVQMQRGSALFDVDRVVGEPVRIVVPGGEIVVVGTRFRVVIAGEGGQVDLYEGKLEFHADDGSVTPILAGQQFVFGRAAVRPPAAPESEGTPTPVSTHDAPRELSTPTKRRPEPTAPATQPSPEPGPSAAAIIEEVQQLRRRGQYDRAASRLRDALRQQWPTRTADVLSYELGTILARHLDEPTRACAHWRQHLQQFRATRYRQQVAASISALSCP
jgi:hypothetical protein